MPVSGASERPRKAEPLSSPAWRADACPALSRSPAARTVLMDLGHRAASAKFVIRDRAGQFAGVDAVVTAEGIRIVRSPPQPPEADAICGRSIATLRREVRGRLLIANERHLRTVLTDD